MRNRRIWLHAGAVCTLVFGTAMFAARPLDDVMKEVGPTCGNLKKKIDAKTLADAPKDAAKLEALFKETEAFWKQRKTADAVKFSADGRSASKAAAKAAKSGKQEAAQTAMNNILATCKGCHAAHREKGPDGKYKIKA